MSIAVPLISAVLAGFVAWIVTLRQGRTARENWVLDKRYELYERVIDGTTFYTGGLSWQHAIEAAMVEAPRVELMRRLMALELIAPEPVRDASKLLMVPLAEVAGGEGDVLQELLVATDGLMKLLRADLVPKGMR